MEIPSVLPPAAALQNAVAGRKTGQADESKAESVAGAIRYLNPRIQFDSDTNTVIIQFRDTKTGEVKEQFPPKLVADAYEKRVATNGTEDQGEQAPAEAVPSAPLPRAPSTSSVPTPPVTTGKADAPEATPRLRAEA